MIGIKGFSDYKASEDGQIHSSYRGGTTLKPVRTHRGYMRVTLCRNGKKFNKSVHRLIAEAFIPNPEGLPEVNHKDFDKSNNAVSNLEWCTRAENQEHADCKVRRGEAHHKAKLTKNDVTAMKQMRREGATHKAIGQAFGVSRETARDACNGRYWND
jgi:hypothetical protein